MIFHTNFRISKILNAKFLDIQKFGWKITELLNLLHFEGKSLKSENDFLPKWPLHVIWILLGWIWGRKMAFKVQEPPVFL